MALNIDNRYSPRSEPADANFPTGSIKNESTPGADDGTPLDKDFMNDVIGARDSVLDAAGIVASGSIDNVSDSDVLQSHFTITSENFRCSIVTISSSELTLQMFNNAKSDITPLNTPMGFTVSETVNQGSTITLQVQGSPNETVVSVFDLVINTVYTVTRIGNGSIVINEAESPLGTSATKVRNNAELDARYVIGTAGTGASDTQNNTQNLSTFYTQAQLYTQAEVDALLAAGNTPLLIWSGNDTVVSEAEILADTGFVVIPGNYHIEVINDVLVDGMHSIQVSDITLLNTNVTKEVLSNTIIAYFTPGTGFRVNRTGVGNEDIGRILFTPF